MPCPACGSDPPVTANFCPACGAKLARADDSSSPERSAASNASPLNRLGPQRYVQHLLDNGDHVLGDRRIVTTLFADIAGSTAMAEKLDPEDITEIMNRAFKSLTEPISYYQGTLARLMGDGVLCLFGAPVAHDDDAVRACQASLEMIDSIKNLGLELCNDFGINSFDVRIGISTGLAVVGEVGTAERAEYTAMGDAVNLAARLQGAAEPGTVLICKKTLQLVRSAFQTRDMGKVELKGKCLPVGIYRLLRPSTPIAMEASAQSPIVGRQDELAALQKEFDKLKAGKSSLVYLHGPGGIGKSKLTTEAINRVETETTWAKVRCHSYADNISYWAVSVLARDIFGSTWTTPPDQVERLAREALLERIQAIGGDITMPLLVKDEISGYSLSNAVKNLLHLPLDAEAEKLIKSRTADERKVLIQSTLIEIIRVFAGRNPLIITIEDVHWIDPQSLSVFESIWPEITGLPVSLILVSRSDWSMKDDLVGRLRERNIPILVLGLGPLSDQELVRLIQLYLEVNDVPPHLVKHIKTVTDGNPFFVEETLRTFVEIGLIERTGPTSIQVAPISRLNVPGSVQATILARMDRLPLKQKKVLQAASVIGRTFPLEILERVVGSQLGNTMLAVTLDVIQRRGFVCPVDEIDGNTGNSRSSGLGLLTTAFTTGPLKVLPGGRLEDISTGLQFAFRNAMTAEVAYRNMLNTERRKLHRLVGEALEDICADRLTELVPTLAFHYERSDNPAKAISYLYANALRSTDSLSLPRASECLNKCLELLEKDKNNESDPSVRSKVWEALGDLGFLQAEYESALSHYERALEHASSPKTKTTIYAKKGRLLQKQDRTDLALRAFEAGLACMGTNFDAQAAGRIYSGMCLVYYQQGDLDNALELGNLALVLHADTDDRIGMAYAHNNLGVVLARNNEAARARVEYEKSLQLFDETGDHYGSASCRSNLGLLAWKDDDINSALEHFGNSLSLFEKLNNRLGMAQVADHLSRVHRARGDNNQADIFAAKAKTIIDETGPKAPPAASELWQSETW